MKRIVFSILIFSFSQISALIPSPCQITLTSAFGTDAQRLCENTAISPISYSVSGTSANVTTLPNGLTSNLSANVFTISGTPTVSGTFNYTVTTAGSACVQKQLTGTIQMDPLPTAYAGSTSPICMADSVSVTGASSGNGTINWTDNGQGVLSNRTTLSPQYKASALDQGKTITLTMTVTSSNSCSGSTAVSTVNVLVRPTLTAVTTVTTSVCQNQAATATFNVTSQGTSPYVFTYLETVNGLSTTKTVTTSALSSTATVSAPTGATGTVVYDLLQIQDQNCLEILPVNTQTMIVNALPAATISQNEEVCRDSATKAILFKAMNGTRPYTYSFTVNNSPAIQKADSVYSIKPATDRVGTFVYTLTNIADANGCSQAIQNQTATVVVHENPQANFSITPQNNRTIAIKDSSISVASWLWDFGDGVISPASDPGTHTYSNIGTYKIKLNVENGSCKDSTEQIIQVSATGITVTTGIQSINSATTIFVSPNPFSNQLSIVVEKNSAIKITNSSGIEVYNGKLSVGKSLIDTNTLSSGVYFVIITDEQGTTTKKLVRE